MSESDVRLATEQAELLHDRLVRAAYALHFSCENIARLLDARADIARQPSAIDLHTDAKRWRRASDQAMEIVSRWQKALPATVAPDDPPATGGEDAGQRVADLVIHELFMIGLRLQAVEPLAAGAVRERLAETVESLDWVIDRVRHTVATEL